MKPPLTPAERGTRGVVKPKYTYKDNKGTRVPGWEEVNFTKLAKDMGVQHAHLRIGLTGRVRNDLEEVAISLRHVLKAAELLGLSMAEVGARIDYTRAIDSKLKAEGRHRMEYLAMVEGRETPSQKKRNQAKQGKPKPAEFRYPSTEARPAMRDYFPRGF